MIVSTPQDVALIDARKGVGMFNKVSIPVSLATRWWIGSEAKKVEG